jgi:hypothetical protein
MRTIRSVHFGTGIALFFAANASLTCAADVTLADLDGAVIEATTVHDQVGVLNGTRLPNRLVQDRKITIGPGPTLQNTIVDTISSERGTRVRQISGTFTINKPMEIGSYGGGHGVYIFANGSLTFLRTHQSGGFKSEITFHRSSAGLTCSIGWGFARENGTGEVEISAAIGGSWKLVSSKQISSSCRVTRR